MRFWLQAVLALICFVPGMIALFCGVAAFATHGLPLAAYRVFITPGAETGALLFVIWFVFASLPSPGGAPPRLGPWRGLWAIAGFGLMLFAGTTLVAGTGVVIWLAWGHFAGGHAMPPLQDMLTSPVTLGLAVMAGEALGGFFVFRLLRGLGKVRVEDGSAQGVGWCAAPRNAYWWSGLLAVLLLGLSVITLVALPPDVAKLQSMDLTRMLHGPIYTLVPLILMISVVAPILEEFVFRGVAFAGLAASCGPVWAGVITSVLFVLAHAPEKISYPPSFIILACFATAAVVLRLRTGSIRPGMLLHMLFNATPALTAFFAH